MSSPINYLALGDSYTVGEGIALVDSFPYQTVQLIRKNGLQCHAPELIAKTGWTTSELASQVDHSILLSRYSIFKKTAHV